MSLSSSSSLPTVQRIRTVDFDMSTTWKMMKDIEREALKAGGTIFGGYPRDKFIHDHYAKLFYETDNVDDSKYADVTYLPELALRTHLPTDIDVFMKHEMLEGFKKKLQDKHLDVVEAPGRGVYNFPGLKHTKLVVTFAMHPALASIPFLKKFTVRMDIVSPTEAVDMDMDPPFGHLDFECNGILLTGNNEYRLCAELAPFDMCPMDKLKTLTRIMKDITEMKAVMFSTPTKPVESYRIKKMLDKKWTIIGDYMTSHFGTLPEDDVCTLCLCPFHDCRYIKLKCCNGFYHPKCIDNLDGENFNDTCPNCRQELYFGMMDRQLYSNSIPHHRNVRRQLHF